MAMTGEQIFHNFDSGTPEVLTHAAGSVRNLATDYGSIAEAFEAMQGQMSQSWTGGAAQSADYAAGPLGPAMRQSAEYLGTYADRHDNQGGAFTTAQASVQQVPPLPTAPSPMDVAKVVLGEGPGAAIKMAQDYQAAVEAHHAANANNVNVMKVYEGATGANQQIPKDYPKPAQSGGTFSTDDKGPGDKNTVDMKPGGTNPVDMEPGDSNDVDMEPGGSNDVDMDFGTNDVDGEPNDFGDGFPPGGGPDGSVDPSFADPVPPTNGGPNDPWTRNPPLPNPPPPTEPPPPTLFPPKKDDDKDDPHDEPAVYEPGNDDDPVIPDCPAPTPFDPPGGPDDSDPPDEGTDIAGIGDDPRGGNLTGVGPVAGLGADRNGGDRFVSGSAAGGDGAAFGAGRGGEFGRGAGAAGAALRSGAAGRGGLGYGAMPPGGRRGEEDDEHNRPDYLIEPDPNSLFGTDEQASSPVIGEAWKPE